MIDSQILAEKALVNEELKLIGSSSCILIQMRKPQFHT